MVRLLFYVNTKFYHVINHAKLPRNHKSNNQILFCSQDVRHLIYDECTTKNDGWKLLTRVTVFNIRYKEGILLDQISGVFIIDLIHFWMFQKQWLTKLKLNKVTEKIQILSITPAKHHAKCDSCVKSIHIIIFDILFEMS